MSKVLTIIDLFFKWLKVTLCCMLCRMVIGEATEIQEVNAQDNASLTWKQSLASVKNDFFFCLEHVGKKFSSYVDQYPKTVYLLFGGLLLMNLTMLNRKRVEQLIASNDQVAGSAFRAASKEEVFYSSLFDAKKEGFKGVHRSVLEEKNQNDISYFSASFLIPSVKITIGKQARLISCIVGGSIVVSIVVVGGICCWIKFDREQDRNAMLASVQPPQRNRSILPTSANEQTNIGLYNNQKPHLQLTVSEKLDTRNVEMPPDISVLHQHTNEKVQKGEQQKDKKEVPSPEMLHHEKKQPIQQGEGSDGESTSSEEEYEEESSSTDDTERNQSNNRNRKDSSIDILIEGENN